MIRDLLLLDDIKEKWKFAEPVDPNDPNSLAPDKMESIFDRDVYRTHPLVLEWSNDLRAEQQGQLSSFRVAPQRWSRTAKADEWERNRPADDDSWVAEVEKEEEEEEIRAQVPELEGNYDGDSEGGGDSPRGHLTSYKDEQLNREVYDYGRLLPLLLMFWGMANDDAIV
uniref:Uncharacterized protein n=1 Tax=Chromera velia CCMP2878 TaxID=1169474 RepID=A0A0G4I5V5_9ALVE|eukprot:Cvel_11242.t1-p1 / transcript=Cvel_11242.t1 / gene=Cvel_11242 / organism=Chromera_velia_CCMP2878 / gene_product=hypothetical protein / transcript_product=hypothetical protein / location=Cvel_scaffold700:50220-50812(+) / protein_length=168 / sequence_SO=supercontig / SO=protein_coding / is_pseudo=false